MKIAMKLKIKMMKELKMTSLEIFESINKNKSLKILNKNIKFRRSIYARYNIKKNEKITNKNINVLRPKIGICASQYFKILGKRSKKISMQMNHYSKVT